MHRQALNILATITILALIPSNDARDLRNVTEPKTPQTCISLKAGGKDDTESIQKALNSCTKGKAVALASGNFNSGPFTIPSGVSLLVDSGVVLRAIPDPKLYDRGSDLCGTIDDIGEGCKPFITISGAEGSGIYGKGTIDGQGGHKMIGNNITWWHLARNALAVHRQQNNPTLVYIVNSTDITLYQITIVFSPFYHVQSSNTNGFTVWGVTVNSSSSALNSDGIDPTGSINVTIAHCNISTGDDNIAISSLHGPARHISVFDNYFGHGNSMAIGSGTLYGVSEVTVSNMTMNRVRYGLYIKSDTLNGGLVANVTYENICLYDSPWPITLTTNYYHKTGNHTPVYRNIHFNNIRVLTNGTFTLHGLSKSYPIEVSFNNVHVAKGSKWSVRYAQVNGTWEDDASGSSCSNPSN
ncbi:endo-polygalacturonase-like [Bacillus rossius redtenbacheri]|uniref:endo-polygalacturonase-like n=1 Tax=Bacillus rossius redtenbacheri TaxID=93214 RepID=UPI002FDDA013